MQELMVLNLERNKVGYNGALALADLLYDCDGLQKLKVRGNNIDESGEIALAMASRTFHCKVKIC